MDIKWRLATLITMLDIACYIFLVISGEFPISGSFYLIDNGYGQVWYVLHYPLIIIAQVLLTNGFANFPLLAVIGDRNWSLILLGYFVLFSQSFWMSFLMSWSIEIILRRSSSEDLKNIKHHEK